MPLELGLKIALEHEDKQIVLEVFRYCFTMSSVVCFKSITYANQAKFVTKNNVSFVSHREIYLFKFLLRHNLYPVFFLHVLCCSWMLYSIVYVMVKTVPPL